MEVIYIKDEFIKLGQAMKLGGLVSSGVEAKFLIEDGEVLVNNDVEVRRGKKLRDGDIIKFNGKEFVIKTN